MSKFKVEKPKNKETDDYLMFMEKCKVAESFNWHEIPSFYSEKERKELIALQDWIAENTFYTYVPPHECFDCNPLLDPKIFERNR